MTTYTIPKNTPIWRTTREVGPLMQTLSVIGAWPPDWHRETTTRDVTYEETDRVLGPEVMRDLVFYFRLPVFVGQPYTMIEVATHDVRIDTSTV